MLPLEGVPTIPEWLAGISAVDLIQTGLWIIFWAAVLLKGWPIMRRLNRVVDILLGAPAAVGVPRQPGVAEVVMGGENLDGSKRPGLVDQMRSMESKVEETLYHSKPNGGGSSFDSLMTETRAIRIALTSVTADVAAVKDDVAALSEGQNFIRKDVAVVQGIVRDHDIILSPDDEEDQT